MFLSVVLPAKDEAKNLEGLLPKVKRAIKAYDAEIIVVNDGSADNTSEICTRNSVRELKHLHCLGNGASVKAGAREAAGEVLVFMDADGQHNPADICELISVLEQGADMVVGARQRGSQASVGRGIANQFYNRLAGYMTGHEVQDLTSGFRAVRASKFREFLYLLPNGFSYPTTCTMAFFRAGYSVRYQPIHAAQRKGKSHIKPLKDGARFLLIIFKVGTLYSPLKLFAPLALAFFVLGLGWYAYTFSNIGRFTNMSALLMSSSFIIFMMGLISEQITALMYRPANGTSERSKMVSND